MTKSLKEIQNEYDNLPEHFLALRAEILKNESLVTITAKHPLYEIVPFHFELENEFIQDCGLSTDLSCPLPNDIPVETAKHPSIFMDSPVGPDHGPDSHYTFKIDPKTKRVHMRSKHYEGMKGTWETVFYYTDQYYKSIEMSFYEERSCTFHFRYLFLKNGVPNLLVRCGHGGFLFHKYFVKNKRLLGYKLITPNPDFFIYTRFVHDSEGRLDVAKEWRRESLSVEVLFKRPEPSWTMDIVFSQIEDYLVEAIQLQILQKVRLTEKVYCLVLEYFAPDGFPPTVLIGVEEDLESVEENAHVDLYYNTPDFKYFEAMENSIQLNEASAQYLYCFYRYAYNMKAIHGQTFEYWDEKVKQVYLKICQRLMHFDFSTSFGTTDGFLVLAREGSNFDAGYFHTRMVAYKQEMGL